MAGLLTILRRLVIQARSPVDAAQPQESTGPVLPVVGQEIAFIRDQLSRGAKAILVHGRAGTGKTTLIRRLIEEAKYKHVIVAPTGIAALNARGQTIHSFFRIPHTIINLEDIKYSRRIHDIVNRMDLLIIDEISMVRADLLDAIDRSLQVNRSNLKPFGGVSVLMVGDFLQLPPVVNEDDQEILRLKGYEIFYAFGAQVFKTISPVVIELQKVHRQNEQEFIDLLGAVRTGRDIPRVVQQLNHHCHGNHKRSNKPAILAATNAAADEYNRIGMESLRGRSRAYEGVIKGSFRQEHLPAPLKLELKAGARVMLVKNDPEKRWVNGSLATVARLSDAAIWVVLDKNKAEYQVDIATWEDLKYEWSERSRRVEQKATGSYSQFPVKLAWAITIHKSQGMTLEDVRIDLGSGAFTHGQTYVALSRATSLDGLSFATPLREGDIRVDQDLVDGVSKLC